MEQLAAAKDEARRCGLALVERPDGLALEGDGMSLLVDLREMIPRLKPDRLRQELLVRAAKVKHAGEEPLAIDATAGLGEDSLLLAAAGFRVTMFERNPVIAALLRDALRRAADNAELAPIVARMELSPRDSIAALAELEDEGASQQARDGERPAVVYLDPMFPARRKSAAVKKKFQLLHKLERPCEDAEALLQAALSARPRKVVVKRPPKGPFLAGVKPGYSLTGKAVRYDVIALP